MSHEMIMIRSCLRSLFFGEKEEQQHHVFKCEFEDEISLKEEKLWICSKLIQHKNTILPRIHRPFIFPLFRWLIFFTDIGHSSVCSVPSTYLMPTEQKKIQCFDLVTDRRVAVSRIIFVLNHGKMHLLDPHTVKYNRVRARSQDKFPPCRSLFIPCYNFGSGKTSGFLCAIRMTSSQDGIAKRQLWRLGIFQRHDCFQDDGQVNFFVFRQGTCWSKIQKANRSQLIKLVEPCSVVISPLDIIPLTEVQRRGDDSTRSSDFSFSATHVGAGGCFEQATCPDFLYDAPAHIFKKNFGKNKCNISFATKCRSDFKYVEPARDKNLGRLIKKPKTQLLTGNLQTGQANQAVKSDLISQVISDMSNWRMLESIKFGKVPIPIYYCVHKKSFQPSKKHFLCPFQVKEPVSGSRHACRTKVFAKIPNDKKDALKEVTKQYLSPEVFDEKLRSLCTGTTELFVVDPREHPRGFVFSIVQDCEDSLCLGKIVFDNDEVRIYKEERHGPFFDTSVKKGCVAFRGLPWLYETTLSKDELMCLEMMHGSRDGCLGSRKSVDMDGFFSYAGPRSSGQASSTPIETSSHGHDLWNMKNSLPSFMTGTLLGRILCAQSDRMLELSGNVIMKAAMIFENAEDDREVGGYENICFHKIITMWFSSVSNFSMGQASKSAVDHESPSDRTLFTSPCIQITTIGQAQPSLVLWNRLSLVISKKVQLSIAVPRMMRFCITCRGTELLMVTLSITRTRYAAGRLCPPKSDLKCRKRRPNALKYHSSTISVVKTCFLHWTSLQKF